MRHALTRSIWRNSIGSPHRSFNTLPGNREDEIRA
jgi:hypothetical protein